MKYKLLVAASAALLLSGSARAQVDVGAIRDPALTEAIEDINAYDALSALPTMAERKAAYRTFKPSTRAAAWRVHMKRYIARTPDLSGEQKAAIEKAIAVFTTELYTIAPKDPRWATQVDAPLKKVREDLSQILSPGAVRELLQELGERDTLYTPRMGESSVADPPRNSNGLGSLSPIAHPRFESPAVKFRGQQVSAWPGLASSQQLLARVRSASPSHLAISPLLFFVPDCSCSTLSDWCG
jgi:hypothetical protein